MNLKAEVFFGVIFRKQFASKKFDTNQKYMKESKAYDRNTMAVRYVLIHIEKISTCNFRNYLVATILLILRNCTNICSKRYLDRADSLFTTWHCLWKL